MLHPGDRLLFIGDSITHAHRRPEEHHDCYQLGHGYVNAVAGLLNLHHPELRPEIFNRGECGDTVAHLQERWSRDCLDLRPDVVSILIGINDASPAAAATRLVSDFESRFQRLLQQTREALPQASVVVLEPFGLLVEQPPVAISILSQAQRENLRTVQAGFGRAAADAGAISIPLQAEFDLRAAITGPAHWALDGIHPSAAGHQLIARAWMSAMGFSQ